MNRFASLTRILLLAFALSALGETPRLTAGPSSLVSAPPDYGPASGAQRIGTLTATSAGWIALWADDTGTPFTTANRRLLASRLRPTGEARDVTGIHLASETSHARFAATPEAGGARAWWAVSGDTGFALHSASVSDDGEVSEADVVGEYPADAVWQTLAVAAAGTRVAALVDRYVMILDGTHLRRTVDLGGFGSTQSIVAAGEYFVVTWVAAGNILMRQTLDLDGNAVGPAGGTGVAEPAQHHALATDGSQALLTWSDVAGLHFGIIDPATHRLAETALIRAPWVGSHAIWNGSSYLVSGYSYEQNAVLGMRVSATGDLLDAEPVRIYEGNPGYYFELAARGGEVAMLHEIGGCVRYSCETEVIVAMLGPSSSGERLVSAAARRQTEPSVASDGDRFFTVWREENELYYAESVARSREPSAPHPLFDSPGFSTTVASDGNGYLAAGVWFRESRYFIEGAALSRDGDGFARAPFSLETGQPGPSSASLGASPGLYLVAWTRGNAQEVVRVKANGELVDSVPIALPSDHYVYMPLSIAFDGEEFVVLWSSIDSAEPAGARVESARVTRGGSARFDRSWAAWPGGGIQGTDIACASGTCLIVWIETESLAVQNWRLRGQRFRTGGALIDATPFDIDVADRTQTRPSVSWDGTRFVVTWDKYIGDVTPSRLEARVVPAAGQIDAAPPDLLIERSAEVYPPATTCNDHGQCVIVGPQFVDDERLGRTSRLFKQFVGEARHRGVRR